ncbi:ABC transporter ATP-binding protein [Leucobacter iarius]|uniref:ABC transporter ATP-binding protein n=1 Tax=Leucobacter iarius TaxID=333963 RepID=A0ABN2LNZ9_9MICO
MSPAGTGGALLVAERASLVVDGATLLPETSVAIDAGECIALLGSNGAGKTTLLRLLSGRVRPSGGRVLLRGRPVEEREAATRRAMAMLIEPPALYPDLTISDHLALVTALWDDAGPVEDALARFELVALRDRFPHELSSGQRQLAHLALVFARPAEVLLLDEPEQRLDTDRRGLLAEAILEARERGTAVACASHDPELVERIADRRVRVGE